ncbi:MAG: septum formation initiator family protein [Firmicutes bacterium]|nr:septum formation initiator family protein [Bacillota bacterium]
MSKKKSKKRKRLFSLVLISLAIIGFTTFTIGKYWVEIYDKYREKKELEKEYVTLKEKEAELKVDANKLQDPDYIARYAREKYLYSKDGEFILKIPEE